MAGILVHGHLPQARGGYDSAISSSITSSRFTRSTSSFIRALSLSLPARIPACTASLTAFSISRCEVTPTFLRNLRISILNVSSFIVPSNLFAAAVRSTCGVHHHLGLSSASLPRGPRRESLTQVIWVNPYSLTDGHTGENPGLFPRGQPLLRLAKKPLPPPARGHVVPLKVVHRALQHRYHELLFRGQLPTPPNDAEILRREKEVRGLRELGGGPLLVSVLQSASASLWHQHSQAETDGFSSFSSPLWQQGKARSVLARSPGHSVHPHFCLLASISSAVGWGFLAWGGTLNAAAWSFIR